MIAPIALALVVALQGPTATGPSTADGTGPDDATAPAAAVVMPGTPSAALGRVVGVSRDDVSPAPVTATPDPGGNGPVIILATWLRDDLGRSRRVVLHEGERMALRLRRAGPEMWGWAAVAVLAGLLAFRFLFRTGGTPTLPAPIDEPTALELARRMVACGRAGSDAAREAGLAQDGLELLRALSASAPAADRSRGPWGKPPVARMVERLFERAGPASATGPAASPHQVARPASPVYARPR